MVTTCSLDQLKYAGRTRTEKRAKIAARYEVFQSIEIVQIGGGGNGVHAYLSEYIMKNCHRKLLQFGSIRGIKKTGHSRSYVTEDKIERGYGSVPQKLAFMKRFSCKVYYF